MLTALDNIRNNLAQAAMSLPSEASSPVVARIDPNDLPLMMIAVSAEGVSDLELSNELARLKPELEQLQGVASVSLLGTTSEEIRVLYDAELLHEQGLSPAILQQLITYQNIVVPSGSCHRRRYVVLHPYRAAHQWADELKDLIMALSRLKACLGWQDSCPH